MYSSPRFPPYITRSALAFLSLMAVTACDPDTDTPDPTQPADVFIVNEGGFNKGNAGISSFSTASRQLMNVNQFQTANNRPLGDVAQSMTVVGTRGYIVVNNSNKLEVVSMPDLKEVATVTGLQLPRYFVAASADKGYVTEWVDFGVAGRVAVIDLKTNTILKTITTGITPETMLLVGNKLYVANNGENTLTIINTLTDEVASTATVGDSPTSLVQDRTGRVWVLNSGMVAYNPDYTEDYEHTTPGSLVSFDPQSPTAQTRRTFASNQVRPQKLLIDFTGTTLYFSNGAAVFRMNTTDAALPTTPIIRRRFYGLGLDPRDNTLYGSLENFSGPTKFIRYQSTGTPIDSFAVGVGANSFVFYRQ
jgi:YVTN family beta-propeller protein